MSQLIQGFVRDLIEAIDGTLVFAGELVEPDEGVFCHHHNPRHPVTVLAEIFDFAQFIAPGI